MNIFVQIASYRDTELIPTIRDCIKKAKYPENLNFGIFVQYGDETNLEDLNEFVGDQFKIITARYEESKGTCWARHNIQKLYRNEKFCLQLDSHHRFVQDWDEKLIEQWMSLKDGRAIISSYPPSYIPNEPEEKWLQIPQKSLIVEFKDTHIVVRPDHIENFEQKGTPIRAVFVAGGFIFMPGQALKDVPYDPDMYFNGEETALTVRYFTHGYNLYHTTKVILYHYYVRQEGVRHWTDHSNWPTYNDLSYDRLNCLLGRNKNHDLGIYGLGSIRTLEDYATYSGINFENCTIDEYTLKGQEPPVKWKKEV